MDIIPETFYHIYNRGNNRQDIFLKRENYLFFLKKLRVHLLPHVDVVAYCLMPNHFHFLVYSKTEINSTNFSNELKVLLRSYTRAINKQEDKVGSLFQQNTKVKAMEIHAMTESRGMNSDFAYDDYPFICFHYIHQNPVKANLVKRMEHWEMSSFRDYCGLRNGTLCNKDIAYHLLEIPKEYKQFIEQSYGVKVF